MDAIAAVEPFVTIAGADGAVPVFSNYAEPVDDLTVAVYFTSDEYVQENPEVVEKFARAMNASQEFAEQNPDMVRAVLPTYTSLQPEVIEQLTLPRYSTEVNRASVEEVARISQDRGLVEELPSMDELLPQD